MTPEINNYESARARIEEMRRLQDQFADRKREIGVEIQTLMAKMRLRSSRAEGEQIVEQLQACHAETSDIKKQQRLLVQELQDLRERFPWQGEKLERLPRSVTHVHVHPKGGLDEFDLSNALMEPETLLQRLYVELSRMCSRFGTAEGQRALLDAVHAYMKRRGMQM